MLLWPDLGKTKYIEIINTDRYSVGIINIEGNSKQNIRIVANYVSYMNLIWSLPDCNNNKSMNHSKANVYTGYAMFVHPRMHTHYLLGIEIV